MYFISNSEPPGCEKTLLLTELQCEQALRLSLQVGAIVLLPTLLPRVELGEAVADDGDGQADDEDAEDGAEAAEDLAEAGDWTDVSVAHLCKQSETEIASRCKIRKCRVLAKA